MSEAPVGPAGWDWAALRAACAREARRLVADAHDADEIAQEAVIRAWRRQASCRSTANPLPWVRQIVRMEAYRLLARRGARHRREGVELDEEVTGVAACHSEAVVTRVTLARALAALRPDERELIGGRYVDDLSQPALAKRLGMPEGTVKVRLHRIRRHLRTVMDETA